MQEAEFGGQNGDTLFTLQHRTAVVYAQLVLLLITPAQARPSPPPRAGGAFLEQRSRAWQGGE
jgi:hypothetical protein